jgi:hypothetical protein
MVTRLSRVGFQNIVGVYAQMEEWEKEEKKVSVKKISGEEFSRLYNESNLQVIDVRSKEENSSVRLNKSNNVYSFY